MIASERSQNIIIIVTIITAIVCLGFSVGNAQYYGGSYILADQLEVNLADINVSNVGPNITTNPGITLTFNLAIPAQSEGNVRITFLGATVWLNDDLLSLTAFAYTPPLADQYLQSNMNRNVLISKTSVDNDAQTIIDAYLSSTWAWNVTLRYSFIVFDEPASIMWRYLDFYTTEVTLT
jgi:hypothetical protein